MKILKVKSELVIELFTFPLLINRLLSKLKYRDLTSGATVLLRTIIRVSLILSADYTGAKLRLAREAVMSLIWTSPVDLLRA